MVAFHVVTMGRHVANELFARNAYREYLELHGLSVQLTEALAELGFGGDDSPDLQAMLSKQAYRGSRYSFGYPACPDVEDQAQLQTLLEWERIGVELSEEFQVTPERSTSAIIVHHPGGEVLRSSVITTAGGSQLHPAL